MSQYVVQADFFGHSVRCYTEGKMVSLTDLAKAGNKWRIANDLPVKQLAQLIDSVGFAEFKAVAEKDMPNEDILRVEGRGNTKRTMGHVMLAVYLAEQFSAEFHYKVIKTFVEGKLLEFRELGGTEFKTLNAAIDKYLPEGGSIGKYINAAKMVRAKILGKDAEAGDWDSASVQETHTRYDIEKRLVDVLSLGVVRDWEHLKELIEKI
jgi:hypothetical protein